MWRPTFAPASIVARLEVETLVRYARKSLWVPLLRSSVFDVATESAFHVHVGCFRELLVCAPGLPYKLMQAMFQHFTKTLDRFESILVRLELFTCLVVWSQKDPDLKTCRATILKASKRLPQTTEYGLTRSGKRKSIQVRTTCVCTACC